MSYVLEFFLGYTLPRISNFHNGCTKFHDLQQIRLRLSYGKCSAVRKCKKIRFLRQALNLELIDHADLLSFPNETRIEF